MTIHSSDALRRAAELGAVILAELAAVLATEAEAREGKAAPVVHRFMDPLERYASLDAEGLNQLRRLLLERDLPRLYSVADAARLLGVSTSYIYDRINERELAVVELGTGRAKQRIRADVLQAFIDGRSHPPA